MQVTIDTNALHTTQAGVARYVRGLLSGLEAISPTGIRWATLAWEVDNFGYRQPQRAVKTAYRELVWPWAVARPALRRGQPDVYHSTVRPLLDPPRGILHVGTLHDLATIRYPERFRPWQLRSAKIRLRRYLKMERVICISRFTADEGIRTLGLDPRRIEVVYNGTDMSGETIREKAPNFAVPVEFFLFVGSLEPGKNLILLKEVYALAGKSGRPLPPLLIVGARWAGVPGEGSPPPDWHYLGRQPDEVLIYLYRRAFALVFPSKYEGFGLPVVEAMQLDCPVICSPVASLPEVVGDAALLTRLDAVSYLDAMRQTIADAVLRANLVARGRKQGALFSWRRCAMETAAVYQAACQP